MAQSKLPSGKNQHSGIMNIEKIRCEFPFFKNNPNVIYFDNAATTQKPKIVLEKINDYYTNQCYNVNRGKYKPANDLSLEIDRSRQKICDFINANKVEEVHFINGASSVANDLSILLSGVFLKPLDEVLLCKSDHKSTVSPWIHVLDTMKEKECKIVPILLSPSGDYDENDLYQKLSNKTKVVILTHIHNVHGMEMNIQEIIKKVREKTNAKIIVDATQSIAHTKVDVQEIDADALYFSGHKMFAQTGIGILWMKEETNQELLQYFCYDNQNPHQLFEKGTPNISGILSLGCATDFITMLGIEKIEQYLLELTTYLINNLKKIESVEFDSGPAVCSCKEGYGIVSFKVDGYHVSEIAEALSFQNIFVRADTQCSYNERNSYLRVSLQIYNTKEEIDRFIKAITQIIEWSV
ncbi:MAG: aminotransferase class V-fold PLP-dependent enzyme [Bacilli bacterium]|nr:aminotransferase class V-fold PLP-dependent enzyme [Bacilli bacterium]